MSEPYLTSGQRVQAAVIGAAVSPLVGILCRTLRWQEDGREHYDAVLRSGRPPILALWHGRILPAIYYFRGRGIVAITSRNFDGEWIARVMARYGFGSARGSSSRGGARALVQLRRNLAGGRQVAFTVDGPRGPARVAQPGAVWLAGATGHPVLPFHIETDRHWRLSSWDRTQVPRPFSRAAIAFGPALEVSSTSDDAVEASRLALEAALGELERRTLTMVGRSAEAQSAAVTRTR